MLITIKMFVKQQADYQNLDSEKKQEEIVAQKDPSVPDERGATGQRPTEKLWFLGLHRIHGAWRGKGHFAKHKW